MFHCFGRKTPIQSKDFIYFRKKYIKELFFKVKILAYFPFFDESKFLKSFDKIALQNFIFISKYLIRWLPIAFNDWFKFLFQFHSYDSRQTNVSYLKLTTYRTKTYNRYLMIASAVYVWNHLHNWHHLQNWYFSSVE